MKKIFILFTICIAMISCKSNSVKVIKDDVDTVQVDSSRSIALNQIIYGS